MKIPGNLNERILHIHYHAAGDSRFLRICLQMDSTLKMFFEHSPGELAGYFPRKREFAQRTFQSVQRTSCQAVIKSLEERLITPVIFTEDRYPPDLLHLHVPPAVLYCRGRTGLLPNHGRTLSVVGTRFPSSKLKSELDSILIPLIKHEICLVSGMALGVDSFAHETAAAGKGTTIAVLAYGFDHTYPKSKQTLKKQLESEQLVVSEYPPYIKPEKFRFPERNRIISALGEAVLVAEAKKRSGSLITAEITLELGKDVYAMPGRLSDTLSEGTNRLIQDGAKLILTADDILEEYQRLVIN
ncbi:DNA-processing protein DprA [Alkalicoccus halolimnae]|uniref:DNA-processing protein DprA n=1 Tax=Alkalicoccus halolimnae TaxID=1667239 RepID=A0AAJ8LUP9_9BACI|nr:DNA-processing protein DprA [Alkalicoccus halolimnae]